MTRKWIYQELADLRFAVNRKVAEGRRIMRNVHANRHLYTLARITACSAFVDGLRAMGLSDDEGMKFGHSNRLPQSVQDQFWLTFDVIYQRDKGHGSEDGETNIPPPPASLDKRHPRWRQDSWVCKCGDRKTLWYKTHLRYKDRYQIYCASCCVLAGWGTKQEFEAAASSGDGKPLVIAHPLDRDLYTPPLLCKPVTTKAPPYIHAKRTQSSIRAKRSQGPGEVKRGSG